jgi:Spy/CpxP family protein refolding chaperone
MLNVRTFGKAAVLPLALVVAFGSICLDASGQDQQRQRRGQFQGRGGFGAFGGPAMLLRNEQVQEELKLTDDQKTKLEEALRPQRGEGFRPGQDLSAEERRELRERFAERREQQEKQINEILTSDQQKRLRQIQLQQRGLAALLDEEVAKEVGVSEEQQNQIREVLRAQAAEQRELGRDASREDRQRLRQQTEEKALAVLTTEQKAKFEELKGEPADIRLGRPGFGRRPGGRGGEGRRCAGRAGRVGAGDTLVGVSLV